MDNKIIQLKKRYYAYLDRKARNIAYNLSKNKNVTRLLLKNIANLYQLEKLGTADFEEDNFEAGYHNPVTSDLELLVSRILFYYSKFKKQNWKIYLRKQGAFNKTNKKRKVITPDIRVVKDDKTLAIIEIKAKAGFMQPFFSIERYKKDMKRMKENKSNYDPKLKIREAKNQLEKYSRECNIPRERVFVFLPSCGSFHQKNYTSKLEDYKKRFAKNSGLPKDNLIILSNYLRFDPSNPPQSNRKYDPSNDFEKFIIRLRRLSK